MSECKKKKKNITMYVNNYWLKNDICILNAEVWQLWLLTVRKWGKHVCNWHGGTVGLVGVLVGMGLWVSYRSLFGHEFCSFDLTDIAKHNMEPMLGSYRCLAETCQNGEWGWVGLRGGRGGDGDVMRCNSRRWDNHFLTISSYRYSNYC